VHDATSTTVFLIVVSITILNGLDVGGLVSGIPWTVPITKKLPKSLQYPEHLLITRSHLGLAWLNVSMHDTEHVPDWDLLSLNVRRL